MVDLELWIKKTQRPAALLLFSLLLSTLICPAEAHTGIEIQASRAPSQSSTKKIRISKSSLLKLVRDFRDRLGKDENLYYLVNPPGGATVEERDEVEGEIVHFLSRIHKDPTLDFPSKWLKELREYELTPAEWDQINLHFQSALAASTLPPPVQTTLAARFARLHTEVLIQA
ncbi:MAG: hypothetical protein KBD07_00885 [Candidatus Omnitrophica bacterium]|nr:hypothetical protein [Candidatus Omnitrophota bacterium]